MNDPNSTTNLQPRLDAISSVIQKNDVKNILSQTFINHNGDWDAVKNSLKDQVNPADLASLDLAHSISVIASDHAPTVQAISTLNDVNSLRDIALNYDSAKLSEAIKPTIEASGTTNAGAAPQADAIASTVMKNLFAKEPSAVLQRMASTGELQITDANIKNGVTGFLAAQPDFNIRTTSIYDALQNDETLKNANDQAGVVNYLMDMQRVQALSPDGNATAKVLNAGLRSAHQITEIPQNTFMARYSDTLGADTAQQVYANASAARIRNEHALMQIKDASTGTGFGLVDGGKTRDQMIKVIEIAAKTSGVNLSWEALFGSVDLCECGDCNSVYSPAAYFVELLQYLRNNDLDPGKNPDNSPKYPNTGKPGIKDTPLEKLFYRRPDLGCLELTCENTNTVLPYIDLVNEVLESFIVHDPDIQVKVDHSNNVTVNDVIDVWNTEDETTGELLAQAQHTNYKAYCILKNEVYPFTLPYHQPIDVIRTFLNFLNSSRYELLNTFQSVAMDSDDTIPAGVDTAKVKDLILKGLQRAIEAEYLGLTEEEYIILTKEAFRQKEYYDTIGQKTFTNQEYQDKIGVRSLNLYYGYDRAAIMNDNDPTDKAGLMFVKAQFLKRTGLQYTELIDMLQTQYINPCYPQGKALFIMDSLRFSYSFLQYWVTGAGNPNPRDPDPKKRLAALVAFLKTWQPWMDATYALLHPDVCHQNTTTTDVCVDDLENWIYCYFDKIGKLIVLESGDVAYFPLEGEVYLNDTAYNDKGNIYGDSINNPHDKFIGSLRIDGTIKDNAGTLLAEIGPDGKIVDHSRDKFFDNQYFQILIFDQTIPDTGGMLQDIKKVGYISKSEVYSSYSADSKRPVNWMPPGDTCDIEKVVLRHLDGTQLVDAEWDRIHRFIRLWRKMGWTMDETDKTIMSLGCKASQSIDGGEVVVKTKTDIFSEFKDDCSSSDGTGSNGDCGDPMKNCDQMDCDITPGLLHQLMAVKEVQGQTGIELIKLLSFWADISTFGGTKSLYARLFLSHNMLGVDTVFQADGNGIYLAKPEKISAHIPVLMAAFNLKADDIDNIVTLAGIDPDANGSLSLHNITIIYHYSLIMKAIGVKSYELKAIVQDALFGDPFKTADATYAFLQSWGKMEDAGFNYRQLNYIITNKDDDKKPLTSTLKSILQLGKTIYDGLNQIDTDNADIINDEDITPDLIRSKTSLLFDSAVVEQMVAFLAGTSLYSTNAPALTDKTKQDDFNKALALKPSLKARLKFDFSGGIQVTGILADSEIIDAKALINDAEWTKAIDRVHKQATAFYNDIFNSIFQLPYAKDPADSKQAILKGDDDTTAPLKLKYFITAFLPFLRERLYHKFLVATLSDASGLGKEETDALISVELVDPTSSKPVIETFKSIKDKPKPSDKGWAGYLIPGADDNYTFAITGDPAGTQPTIPTIDGVPLVLHQQADPTNLWISDPVKLKAGKPYFFIVKDLAADLSQIKWKTATSPTSSIPSSVLLPDCSSNVKSAFIQLQKAAILATGFKLNADELDYLQKNGADFDGLNFNHFTFKAFMRLQAYVQLRNSLPATDTSLISFFGWARKPDTSALSDKITQLTLWKQSDIDKLIANTHFGLLHPSDFINEINLLKLQNALYVADKISMDINLLFQWAIPTSKFWVCHDIAESIQKTLKARYRESDWEQVVKPLNDQLRTDMRDALVSYLLVRDGLVAWGVVDENSLFEFFLIDTQMDSCMQTSRMKQAISSVQLFIQRCFLGLEQNSGITNEMLDRDRWSWMQRDVLWEANRKVFLYPENWIDENLRDDKSSFYKELESELLQRDISTQTVEDALKNYLYKLDEVANMNVVGFYVDDAANRIHIFSRTRNAPYSFYYRYYKTDEKTWIPWEKLQVDIPSYDYEDANNHVIRNGSYLIPVALQNRLLIFFPQIVKKTKPNTTTNSKSFHDIGNDSPDTSKPKEFWEIKMGWSEYRNGKWTQKQVSKDAVYKDITDTADIIDNFKFIPIKQDNFVEIGVDDRIDNDTSFLNVFHFEGSKIKVVQPSTQRQLPSSPRARFINGSEIFSFNKIFSTADSSSQAKTLQIYHDKTSNSDKWGDPDAQSMSDNVIFYETEDEITESVDGYVVAFYHPYTHQLLSQVNQDNLIEFFECNPNTPYNAPDGYISKTNTPDNTFTIQEMFGQGMDEAGNATFNELKAPYSLYNWEMFFHLPATLAGSLSKSQQFENSMNWYHYIFNPLVDKGNDEKRFWRFAPFQHTDAHDYLVRLFNSLMPNTPDPVDGQINEWRNNPFQPHVIARQRPSAYMKWVVMKYLDNIIAWGDYLFTQHTIESINQATQLYILASHILGQRPQVIPKRGKIKPESYMSLLDKWDAFGNAMVEMELIFPFSNQAPLPFEITQSNVVFPNIFGFATSLYFCIPGNPKLLGYWDIVDDRLYKIRHCENIEGVFGLPPLWDAPIDPSILVNATAQGLSLDSVLNDLNSPMPNYRFNYLVAKSLELCNELKGMGNALMSVFEKKDGEALALLRSRHEVTMNNLVMEVKKKQLDEANAALDGLLENRKTPAYRLTHYLNLLGEDSSKIPDSNTDFTQVADTIEKPVDDSGLKLIEYEREEMDKANAAADWQTGIGVVETLASIFHALPTINGHGTPLGVGVAVSWGFPNLANATSAVARGLQIYASHLSHQSSSAQRKNGFLRQMQDRVLQANIAGHELKQIDKQIASQQIRIEIANQEISNQQQMIDNSNEVVEFLTDKYTNDELYSWMRDSIKTLYYQVYKIGYDLAKKAEKVYCFERGLTTSNFIQYGYWDASRDGLMAGERLYVGIKQLEAAYQEKRGYDFEISKPVSLRQIDPLALLNLRSNGACEFELPEILFDMDFPGHYLRKIKSVSLSIPCIIGPYTTINATLRLIENKIRLNSLTGSGYPELTDQEDDRFMTVNVPIDSIAVSNGLNDSGVFELNFKDERYMPFEGAGAVSKWRLELPADFRQFDYETINDVIVHVRYTAANGGDKLKGLAVAALKNYLKSVENLSQDEGLFTFFELKNDFANEWYKAMQLPPDVNGKRTMNLNNLADRLPVFTKGGTIKATDIILATTSNLNAGDITLTQNNVDNGFTAGPPAGNYHSYISNPDIPIDNWQLSLANANTAPEKIWLAIRYTMS